MKLFICHASEDKDGFVRPLAESLKATHEVWFDEWSLTLGDSLLRKINEGLTSCDFGVVVLSPSFFSKSWPQNELDGLLALENTTRKIILPIWKDLTAEDVRRYSPILAGRLAVLASDGVQRVVKEIERAVDVSTRTREINVGGSVLDKAKRIGLSIAERNNSDRLMHCEEGVKLIFRSINALSSRFRSLAAQVQQTTPQLRITVASLNALHPELLVSTNYRHEMHIALMGLGGNYSNAAELRVMLTERGRRQFEKSVEIMDLMFKPNFLLPQRVVWHGTGETQFSGEALADHLLGKILNHVEAQLRTPG